MIEHSPRGFDPLYDGATILTLYEYFNRSGANARLLSFHTSDSVDEIQASLDALCRDGLVCLGRNGNYFLTEVGMAIAMD